MTNDVETRGPNQVLGLYKPAKYLASSLNDYSKPKTQVAQVLASIDPSSS